MELPLNCMHNMVQHFSLDIHEASLDIFSLQISKQDQLIKVLFKINYFKIIIGQISESLLEH